MVKKRKIIFNRKANIFIDYAIILIVVLLTLVGMELYIRRGVQGKIKDAAYIIAEGKQLIVTDPTSSIGWNTVQNTSFDVTSNYLEGGAKSVSTNESVDVASNSYQVSFGTRVDLPLFIPSQAGAAPAAIYDREVEAVPEGENPSDATDYIEDQVGRMSDDEGVDLNSTRTVGDETARQIDEFSRDFTPGSGDIDTVITRTNDDTQDGVDDLTGGDTEDVGTVDPNRDQSLLDRTGLDPYR